MVASAVETPQILQNVLQNVVAKEEPHQWHVPVTPFPRIVSTCRQGEPPSRFIGRTAHAPRLSCRAGTAANKASKSTNGFWSNSETATASCPPRPPQKTTLSPSLCSNTWSTP